MSQHTFKFGLAAALMLIVCATAVTIAQAQTAQQLEERRLQYNAGETARGRAFGRAMPWKRSDGPVPSPLFTERAAELARAYHAPAPRMPAVLETVLPGRRIVLRDPAPQACSLNRTARRSERRAQRRHRRGDHKDGAG